MEYNNRKYQELDRLEAAAEVNVKEWIKELYRLWMDSPVEKRAYQIIKGYIEMESPTPQQRKDFLLWMTDKEHAEAKEKAMDDIMAEYI